MAWTLTTGNMPLKKTIFQIVIDKLEQAIDVDDSTGRSVPINMNFVDEGYLTKDTGIELFGAVDASLRHSLYNYKKKNGTNYILSVKGTKLQKWNNTTLAWEDLALVGRTATVSIATPAVVTLAGHGFLAGTPIVFSTTGALPTGITAGTTYYVIAAGLTTDTFEISATPGGAAINTSGTQSGVHTITGVYTNLYTANAEFGWNTYNDALFGCNAVEDYLRFDGTSINTYPGNPKGNVLEVFEDRMFVTGVTAEPLSYYYSNVGDPTTFAAASVVKPLGTDYAVTAKNYYGVLMMFKTNSIWKLTFEYDQVLNDFIPKIANQSLEYGACSRKAVTPVENSLWFFTGREVREIGLQPNQIGVFGVDKSVISDPIKSTLQLIPVANMGKCATFYNNRRFYLCVPLTASVADTTFVCHTLHSNAWTKYTERDKAKINDFMVIDGVVYTTVNAGNFGVKKWNTALDDISTPISSSVLFKVLEDQDFNHFRLFRYLDLKFKDLQAVVTVTVRAEANDAVSSKTKPFYVGNVTEDQNSTMGEVPLGNDLLGDGFGEDNSVSPFVKRRVSFLTKNQALLIGLSNARLAETFSLSSYILTGSKEPDKMFDSKHIISVK